MRIRQFLVAAAVAFGLVSDAASAEISYLRRGSNTEAAVVEDSDHRAREIRPGDLLPELGELKEIGDDELVFERALGDQERAQLKALGLAAPDVRRVHLMRRDGSRAAASMGGPSAVFSGD